MTADSMQSPVVVSANLTSADIPSDEITVELSPPGSSGTLTVELLGTTTHTVYQGVRSGGTHDISFDIPNLPNGQTFSQILATWTTTGGTGQDTLLYNFKVLGDFENTRYNTPTESFCSGDPVDMMYVTGDCDVVQSCDFTAFQGKSGWWSEVFENGSGYSSTQGIVSLEWHCGGAPTYDPPRRLRKVPTACPECGGSLQVGGSVAVNHADTDLPCDATLYVYQVGIVKVADTGSRVALNQLDHYAGFSGCNREGGTIGIRKVVRLF